MCGGVLGFLKDERRYEAADYWVDHSVGSFVRGSRDTDQDAAREPPRTQNLRRSSLSKPRQPAGSASPDPESEYLLRCFWKVPRCLTRESPPDGLPD